MNSIRAKLKSRAGESLAEVLIALLVAALGVTMLASMITSSFNMITGSRSKLESYYQDALLASPPSGTTATVTISQGGTSLETYTVQTYTCVLGGDNVTSYALP